MGGDMSHLPVWEREGLTWVAYWQRAKAELDRAYLLAKSGLTTHEAARRVIAERDQ
jgi:hypothetical protein